MNSWQTISTNCAGRLTRRYQTDGGGDSAWSDADDVTGDIVLNQQEYSYDAAGNLIFVVNRDRFHDDASTATGELGTPTTGNKARGQPPNRFRQRWHQRRLGLHPARLRPLPLEHRSGQQLRL